MRHHRRAALLLLPAFLIACESNPAGPAQEEEEHGHELLAELSLSEEHVHTLSEITFSVTVTNDHGEAVTDLESVAVESLATGSDTWRATELELTGTAWTAPYTFVSSGDYQLRVTVLEHGAVEPEVVHTMSEPLGVARAHVEIDGMRVEFETFPGHLHEGETGTATFWVMEAEQDAEGNRAPLSGLSVAITCEESDGTLEEHGAVETEPGVYTAEHTFGAPGEFHAGIRIGSDGGQQMETDFHTHVAHGH